MGRRHSSGGTTNSRSPSPLRSLFPSETSMNMKSWGKGAGACIYSSRPSDGDVLRSDQSRPVHFLTGLSVLDDPLVVTANGDEPCAI